MNNPIESNIRLKPVIRLFVSSTFSDMKNERNVLQEQVFPRLELLCLENGFQFQAIDLRWGVSSEAGFDHRAMRICFEELRRAQEISPKPNFLIMLGNRYGWRPLPEEISVDEFEELDKIARAESAGYEAVLNAWYKRDDNAVPPVYLLQSRRQQLSDALDYTQDAHWNKVQEMLWVIINRAMPPEQLQGRFDAAALANGSPPAIVRFQASATEQEIWHGALRIADAQEHVLAFFRQFDNSSEFPDPNQIKDFIDLTPSGNIDATLTVEQNRLKDALRQRLDKANVFEADSARLIPTLDNEGLPSADVTVDHLAQLCSDVETRLTQIIEGQIAEYWEDTAAKSVERAMRELKIEQDEHARFGHERGGANTFTGRKTELQAILDYVRNKSPWPLVVHGSSGCGKTALLARAAEEIQKTAVNGHQPEVIVRFVGVTPHSSDVRSLLSSICQQLRLWHPRAGELPSDFKAWQEELTLQLRSATPEQPLVLILDALDQLSDSDNGRQLGWIPAGQLLPQVKIIVSCLAGLAEGDPAGQPFTELTRRQLTAEGSVNLDALSMEEARTLLFTRWLPQAGRTVNDDQQKSIIKCLQSAQCRQPIYLKLLFEEARIWRSYDDKIPELGDSVSALLCQFFKRLARRENHGRLLVKRVLGYLASSRHGLTENEILEILFVDPEYKEELDQSTKQKRHELPISTKRIPIAIWSRLRFDLAPYLTERAAPGANVLTFYHRQVAEWELAYLAKMPGSKWSPHERLANYFETQAINERTCDELPWQLKETGSLDRLRACLLDIDRFILIMTRDEGELRGYWVKPLQEELTMGEAYLKSFDHWADVPDCQQLQISYAANQLFVFLFSTACYKAAEPLMLRALAIDELSYGADHPTVAIRLNNLAMLLKDTNRLSEAEPLMRRALAIDDLGYGADHPIVAIDLNNLAQLLQATNRLSEAESLMRRALAIDELSFGPDHPAVARDLNNLAGLLQSTNRLSEAEPLMRRALAIDELSYGTDHPKVAIRLSNLAGLLHATNRLSDAEPLMRRALAIDELSFGPDHPNVAIRLNNLA